MTRCPRPRTGRWQKRSRSPRPRASSSWHSLDRSGSSTSRSCRKSRSRSPGSCLRGRSLRPLGSLPMILKTRSPSSASLSATQSSQLSPGSGQSTGRGGSSWSHRARWSRSTNKKTCSCRGRRLDERAGKFFLFFLQFFQNPGTGTSAFSHYLAIHIPISRTPPS